MISVLTLTYGRKKLLEESIFSFLQQNTDKNEMVIINDEVEVKYKLNYPNVKIINLDKRFSSISKKLEWGFKQCKYEYIYRLDDDDLLSPNALKRVEEQIIENPNYEVYRNYKHYYFEHNKFLGVNGSINTGNVYTKKYLNRINFGDKNFGEDDDITFKFNAKIHESNKEPTMIYRWGMNTYHVSGMGDIEKKRMENWVNKLLEKNNGEIDLLPKFNDDYYKILKN